MFEKEQWVKIKKSNPSFCSGQTIVSEKKKGAKFWFSWTTENSYLRVKGEDERILNYLIQKIGKPNLKWTMRGWFCKYTMYAWEKDPKRVKILFNSLCFTEATKNNGIFSLLGLGHRDAQLLQS